MKGGYVRSYEDRVAESLHDMDKFYCRYCGARLPRNEESPKLYRTCNECFDTAYGMWTDYLPRVFGTDVLEIMSDYYDVDLVPVPKGVKHGSRV